MPSNYMTPGVYIEEKNAFPGSAVAVETAIPVFIGYTEKAERKGKSLKKEPTRVSSFAEYAELFGHGFQHKFSLDTAIKPFKPETLTNPATVFYFYNSIRLFYQNGGSNCYIMSLGTYGGEKPEVTEVKLEDFTGDDIYIKLEKFYEPTMVVTPDILANFATKGKECYSVYTKVLAHCAKTQSRFGIFDVYHNPKDKLTESDDIQMFRDSIGTSFLNYGAAYYPWLNTSIVNPSEIDFNNLAIQKDDLIRLLLTPVDAATIAAMLKTEDAAVAAEKDVEKKKILQDSSDKRLQQSLVAASPVYVQIMDEIRHRLNLLPPGAAMAGIYTLVDSSRGVWKSPANISVSMVNSPSVNISGEQQQSMNIDVIGGKSINVIRPFPGIGTLVWGARTLDGNSQDWRYINVRRTMIMIEQSLKLASRAFVFEPNDANTWVTMKSMMNNFLNNLWKQGALTGAVPEQAFDVQIGLGATMTATDILDGYLLFTIKLALVRPAEFIVLTFQQQQQQS